MKKSFIFSILTLALLLIVGACGDNNIPKDEKPANDGDTTNQQTENEENNGTKQDTSDSDDDLSSLLDAIEEADDQLNLSLGETGSFVTTLGTYDMTVTSAEIKGYEFDGNESELDTWVLLDVTIKNTSEEPLVAEDLMESMELTEDEEGSGYMDASGAFDSVQEFQGEIAPGQEQSAQFIAYAYESDTYYFRKSSGNVAGGSSNQVMWKITENDMKQ